MPRPETSHTSTGGRPTITQFDLGDDLARALAAAEGRGGLALAYQPQVDLVSGHVLAVEALARWTHPQRGPVPPSLFIPLAEETGLIETLGRWVLAHAVLELSTWRQTVPGTGELGMAVNVSARELTPGLVRAVDAVCVEADLDPAYLTLEVTETCQLDPRIADQTLAGLQQLGVRIALDDFGTGYSTLAHLQHLPVEVLKLDRTFVMAPHTPAKNAVVLAIRVLADELGLEVVAEGIETPAERVRLVQLGFTTGQGYLFSRPVPPDQITALLTARELTAASRTARAC